MTDPIPGSGQILPSKPWASEAGNPRPWRLLARVAGTLVTLTLRVLDGRAHGAMAERDRTAAPYSEQVLLQIWPVRENAHSSISLGFDRPTGED
jgi:hypothetical protein